MDNVKRMRRYIPVALLILLCIGSVLGGFGLREERLRQATVQALQKLEGAEGSYDERVLVLENTTPERAEEISRRLDAQLSANADGNIATLALPEGVCVRDVFADRQNADFLAELTPEYYYTLDEISEADVFGYPDYPITDRYYSAQQNIPYLSIGNTWSITKGKNSAGERVVVAVIDTGIDSDHPEFQRADGRVMSELSYNSRSGRSVKDYGWSVVEDDAGHGTAVTGVIAAQMNGLGTVGIAPDVEIMVIKANEPGETKLAHSSIVNGIDYAIKHGARVLNMSFSRESAYTSTYFEGIANQGVIPVASSGNTGSNLTQYPAADPYVIGVGALAYSSWSLASFSTYGKGVDIVAPGDDIYTPKNGGGYAYVDGTSFSCPTVSAAVALYLAHYGSVGYDELTMALYGSCMDLGASGADIYFGNGALQIEEFLAAETLTLTLDYRASGTQSETMTVVKGRPTVDLPVPADRGVLRFEGWYLDARLTQKLDLTSGHAFSEDATVYARWLEDSFGDFDYYTLTSTSVSITAYRGNASVLEIPAQINGKAVSGICDGAMKQNTDLTAVKIPLGVHTVGTDAFAGCEALRVAYVDSLSIARALTSSTACGRLCEKVSAIAVPATYGVPTSYVKSRYTHTESLTLADTEYTKYAKHASEWVQSEILSPRVDCVQDGLARFACTACGMEKTQVLLKHVACEWLTQTPCKCTEDGLEIYRCTACQVTVDSRPIPAEGHKSAGGEQIVPPTCEQAGYTQHMCLSCHESYRTAPVAALGHKKGAWSVAVNPGKTTDGYEHVLCLRCESELSGRKLFAYTHLVSFEKDVASITDTACEEDYKIITYCLRYYGGLSDLERLAVARDYELLAQKIAAYNKAAEQKNEALISHTNEASGMLSEIYDGLAALWYACKRGQGKGA